MSKISQIIRNTRVVDGNGRPSYVADVAVAGDRIAGIGNFESVDAPKIDAKGHVLSPGFVEIHTHYDPQLCWDRMATPALEHGCTTVVTGNCSLSLAPLRTGDDARITSIFGKIEDIPKAFFDTAVPYSWQSFGEFMDFIRPDLGVNVGFLVGHTPLRHFVMGEDAQKRVATDAEIQQMCELLAEAIQQGALGLSISYADTDVNNVPVASCWADVRERVALARTVTANGRHFVQGIRAFADYDLQYQHLEELGHIALESGALVAGLTLLDSPVMPGRWRDDLKHLEDLQKRGARVMLQTTPRTMEFNFQLSKAFFTFYVLPAWSVIMLTPMPERIKLFRDMSRRAQLEVEIQGRKLQMSGMYLTSTECQANKKYEGWRVQDIAAEIGKPFADTLIELALEDDLETTFSLRGVIHADVENVSTILSHPLVQVGASDSGAHVEQFSGAGDPAFMIENYVRKHGKMSLERAIQRMTSELANDAGIRDRGTIEAGRFADLVLFDADTITRGPESMIYDMPGGGGRYIRKPSGIDMVMVNGEIVVQNGDYTGKRPGRVV